MEKRPTKSVSAKPAADSSLALEGKRAPAFTLPDARGARRSLDELRAKGPVVLYFYPKDMTPGCTTEACDFRDHQDDLAAAGAQVVGISNDSVASHAKFTDKHGLGFTLLSDEDRKVSTAYRVYKQKSLYGRTFMGIERTTFLIDRSGVIRKVFPKVKVASHAQAVLAALKELQ